MIQRPPYFTLTYSLFPSATLFRSHGGIQVIARTSRIMRALCAHPQGLSLGGIAAEVGLPLSTVQRIVTALVAENLLEPAGAAGGFRLGPALGQLQIGRAHV